MLGGGLEEVESDEEDVPSCGNKTLISSFAEVKEDEACLVYLTCLLQLANLNVPSLCPRCSGAVSVQVKKSGTAVSLVWVRRCWAIKSL